MDELLQRVRLALADSYDIEAEIGRGGMAIVFLGRDLRHQRSVAVKILPPHLASAIGHERFLQEIELAAGLSHPYILPVLDSGECDGLLYYTMPLVEGENLRERLSRERQLPIEDALRIATEMAEALGHAHALGVVHRDVKPSNIMLTHEHALLADFGVARAIDRGAGEHLTGTGLSVGTPAYMSPQQGLADEHLDGSSDQYSLACVIYEMLAGGPPFEAPTPDAVLRQHVMDPVPPLRTVRPSAPAAVEDALARALSKSPASRFPSMEAFAEALLSTGGTDGDGSPARPGSSPGRRAALVAGGGLVLAAAAFALSSLVRGGSGGDAAGTATSELPRLALLPCATPDPADSLLGVYVARDVYLRLEGFPFAVTPYAQSEAWVIDQALHGVEVSDSVPAALEFLRATSLGICSVRSIENDSIEVDYQLYGAGEFETHTVHLARTSPEMANVIPLVADLAGLLSDGSTSSDPAFDPTSSIDALRYYFRADDLFLQDRFNEAELVFGQAAVADPEFTLARWRQADSRRWRAGPALESIDIGLLFAEQGHRLGTRDSLLLWALVEPPGPDAFARFETVLDRLPGDAYATLLYGDELLHRGPLWGIPLDSAEVLITAATVLNPRFGPAWDHLAQVRIRLGKQQEAEMAVERLEALAAQASAVEIPLAMIWRHGWLERFDTSAAAENRPHLQENLGLLATVARQVRYGDLPRAQLELGRALIEHPETRRGDANWHSGVIATGLALASLGRPAAASTAFIYASTRASDGAGAARLFAVQWEVVPFALGLEGFSATAAEQAAERLVEFAEDSVASALHRARAAWALALYASARGEDLELEGGFDRWQSFVESLTASDSRIERLALHLGAVAHAREEQWSDALESSQALVAYDSTGNLERPFARAALYLHRADWLEATDDFDGAITTLMWHENTDLESVSPRTVQAGEVDGAFGSHARLRIARLAAESGREDLAERACREAREVVRRWENPEPGLADAVDEARRIAEVCQP